MIDIENEIFDTVATKIRANHKDAYIVGEYVRTPSRFPCVSLIEMDNKGYERTEDSSGLENHVSVMYEVNIYSNKKVGKKAECKAIATLLDKIMLAFGFTRTMLQPIPNLDDATIYRIVGRYSAVISKNKEFFRR